MGCGCGGSTQPGQGQGQGQGGSQGGPGQGQKGAATQQPGYYSGPKGREKNQAPARER